MKKKSSKSITNKTHNKNIINIHIGDKGKKKRSYKKSGGPSQGHSMTYITPALAVTNKLPYDTTPYSSVICHHLCNQ